MPWIIDAFLIDHQGLGQGTDLEETVPVTARPGEAGDFQTEHRAGLPEADISTEGLEADAPGRRGAGAALILVDDGALFWSPPEVTGPLHQIILACGTGGVFPHLEQSGLPNRDKRPALKMVRTNFGYWVVCDHRKTPCSAA